MALFDDDASLSEEVAALTTARELLAATTPLQELLEAATQNEALALILPGPLAPPQDGDVFTIGELENRIAYAQIHPQLDEDSYLATLSRAVGNIAEKEGLFHLHIRRQIRQREWNEPNGRADIYLWFLDRTSKMCEDFIEAADLNLNAQQIKRRRGPLFSAITDRAAQGLYIWADFIIPWGGSERNQ